jgi:hypothetical protein
LLSKASNPTFVLRPLSGSCRIGTNTTIAAGSIHKSAKESITGAGESPPLPTQLYKIQAVTTLTILDLKTLPDDLESICMGINLLKMICQLFRCED